MSQDFKNLDMTMMFAIHDALRRELERIARITARVDEDPRHVLSTAVGWELFKKFLVIHHTSEDITVWPVMQEALAGKPSELALLDAMEAEHAVIDPLLADIDTALADRDSGLERLGGLVDTLYTSLSGHLDHEERDALQLMDITLNQEQWAAFSSEQRGRVGQDSVRYLPWLLDDMDAAKVAKILGGMPEPLRKAYETEWRVAYEALDIWGTKAADPAGR
ncbi:hemerythrin domain-containing protein [Streptomyces sp. HUCO-GS316]|uniref:hemerythrin domain-containing protein n=1 Tax=Streptomyces sp. HUCO-GS316 TaxID=2692198 RepID=UPI00136B21A8|nr:hemerythrin domain-containing protein [Streptomyces sp. HUCO-GS316]MXM68923.1 hemerythrin domain-containing protein [Streptomyces sp. HUCO-GS316]